MLKKWALIFLAFAVFVGTSFALTPEECMVQLNNYLQNCVYTCVSAIPHTGDPNIDDWGLEQQSAQECGTKCTNEGLTWLRAQYPECLTDGSTPQSGGQPSQQTPQEPSQQPSQQTPEQPPKEPEEECENLYSDCIQQQACEVLIMAGKPAEAQAQTCFNTCQRQVEAKRGAKCVLLPGKATPWFGTGRVKSVEGNVHYITPEGTTKQLSLTDTIPPGSHVFTENGKSKIIFEDGSTLELTQYSSLNYVNDGYRLSRGTMRNFIQCSLNQLSPGSFACPSISTPLGRFRVRGTDLILYHLPSPLEETVLYVKEGQVEAVSKITGESQIVSAGEKLFIDSKGVMDKITFNEDDWDIMMETIQIKDSFPFSFLVIMCWLAGIGVIAYVIWRLVRKLKNRASGSSDAKVNKKGFRKEDNTCKCGNKITKSVDFCPQCGRKIG